MRFLNKCERGLSAKYNSKKIKNEKKSNILRIFRPSANLKAFEKNNNNDINNPSLRDNGFFLCVHVKRRILHFIFKLLKTSQLTKC